MALPILMNQGPPKVNLPHPDYWVEFTAFLIVNSVGVYHVHATSSCTRGDLVGLVIAQQDQGVFIPSAAIAHLGNSLKLEGEKT